MGKAARIKRERKEGRDLRHTVVSKTKNRFEMNNPANSEKKKRLDREKARSKRTKKLNTYSITYPANRPKIFTL